MVNTIVVKDICSYAMFDTDGEKLRDAINANWDADTIILDFKGIQLFATMFFNASIGWLVMQYGEEEVVQRIKPCNLSRLGEETYQHSFENAVAVRRDPQYAEALAKYPDED